MSNLNKYKRTSINLLEEQQQTSSKKEGNRKRRNAVPLTEKFTMNFTKEEAGILYKINEETGIPISTLLRKKLMESGLFN